MERNWVKLRNRALLEYRQGIKYFLDFAFEHTTMGDKIYCPCKKCNNYFAKTRDDVEADCLLLVFSQVILIGLDMVMRDIFKHVIVWIVMMSQTRMALVRW